MFFTLFNLPKFLFFFQPGLPWQLCLKLQSIALIAETLFYFHRTYYFLIYDVIYFFTLYICLYTALWQNITSKGERYLFQSLISPVSRNGLGPGTYSRSGWTNKCYNRSCFTTELLEVECGIEAGSRAEQEDTLYRFKSWNGSIVPKKYLCDLDWKGCDCNCWNA